MVSGYWKCWQKWRVKGRKTNRQPSSCCHTNWIQPRICANFFVSKTNWDSFKLIGRLVSVNVWCLYCLFVYFSFARLLMSSAYKIVTIFSIARCNDCQAKSFFLTPFVNSICFQIECKKYWKERNPHFFWNIRMWMCETRQTCAFVHCVHNHFVIQETINSLAMGCDFVSSLLRFICRNITRCVAAAAAAQIHMQN